MVDRPRRASPSWLKSVTDTYGECQLYPMTATGERGLACRMRIESDSIPISAGFLLLDNQVLCAKLYVLFWNVRRRRP